MKIRNRIALVIVAINCIICSIICLKAQDVIPVHFDLYGEVDRYGSKYELLLLPIMSFVIWILLIWLSKRKERSGEIEEASVISGVNIAIMLFFLVLDTYYFLTSVGVISPENSQGEKRIPRIIMLVVCIISIVVGNVVPKIRKNLFIGVRTPWSMKNDVLWMKNQRMGGFLMVISGLAGLLLNIIFPHPYGTIPSLIIIIAVLIISILYSYIIYLKERRK